MLVEIYKDGGPALEVCLLDLFHAIWKTETIPDDLKDANIVTIFKKGDKTDCGDYRGISLLSVAGEILTTILASRLETVVENILPVTEWLQTSEGHS